MKALLSKQTGGPDSLVLEDVPDPVAGPGEVLIAVRACVNAARASFRSITCRTFEIAAGSRNPS